MRGSVGNDRASERQNLNQFTPSKVLIKDYIPRSERACSWAITHDREQPIRDSALFNNALWI